SQDQRGHGMDRAGRGGRGDRRGVVGVGPLLTDLLAFLQNLPPGLLYTLIGVLAALENVFPVVPADSAVALGAFLAGRGTLHAGVVFGLTWSANVAGGAAVYWLARRYGRAFFTRPAGRRLLPAPVLAHIEAQYRRHGAYGNFLFPLVPRWRPVVPPFAGVRGQSAPPDAVPLSHA